MVQMKIQQVRIRVQKIEKLARLASAKCKYWALRSPEIQKIYVKSTWIGLHVITLDRDM